ncbi:hypothetical protein LguiA_016089 [Lonicera macranthoides]
MEMEQPASLDCGACLRPENVMFNEGDCVVTTSGPQKPVKKQTRQWAAWTRQEEESFFTALRQVGKNFEKITSRVRSKNKDQVRHYYYRLVRRMNKLLGPDLCLDAKNSKDTNAAMLRWWSLLEKYSCKASKLHLKPRRFKIFVETLEHQLLKDRKKSKRKRHCQEENCSPTASSATVSNQGKTLSQDARAVKVVFVDKRNIQKLGAGKGSSLRRNANIGINRTNCKGESSPVKKARQRRKPGTASTAAYKRWEKAAIAGVSLVADAAEHLERTAEDKVVEPVQDIQGQKSFEPAEKDVPSFPTILQNRFTEKNIQNLMKLKLQLFPIDEVTRRALETDNHNPYLELTLSTRKKISSVLEHLSRKWGSSSVASGELVLFPYCVQKENMVGYQKWTQNSALSAADIYALIGSPSVFRLKYGWFTDPEHKSPTFQEPLASSDILSERDMNTNDKEKQNVRQLAVSMLPKDKKILAARIAPSSTDVHSEIIGCVSTDPNKNLLESSDHAPTISGQGGETGNGNVIRQAEHMDEPRLRGGSGWSAGEWADSLTNISVSDLLSGSSQIMDANSSDLRLPTTSQYPQQSPFTCDSFDAAVAAHIYKHQNKSSFHLNLAPPPSSILDAEETCDGFSFQKNSVFCQNVQVPLRNDFPRPSKDGASKILASSTTAIEELPEAADPVDDDPTTHEDLMDVIQSDRHSMDNHPKDLSGLTDLYWPDSLGPLDLDIIPSCRYHSEDLILSDSLGGLNRLIASSLDAFQNCSFFGLDKKEAASTVEARETSSFSDHKIGTQV